MVFKKGQSGNPSGISRWEKMQIDAARKGLLKLSSQAVEVTQDTMLAGTAESWNAAKYVLDQTVGKATEKMEIAGKDGGPIQAVINFGKRPDDTTK